MVLIYQCLITIIPSLPAGDFTMSAYMKSGTDGMIPEGFTSIQFRLEDSDLNIIGKYDFPETPDLF